MLKWLPPFQMQEALESSYVLLLSLPLIYQTGLTQPSPEDLRKE